MKKSTKTIYLCQNCGNEFSAWSGRCESCGEWNSLKELSFSDNSSGNSRGKSEIVTKKLSEIHISDKTRLKSTIGEFNRVLGGGIVAGSVILLGGEPGIGKSTLILQVAKSVGDCLYVSAEESLEQIKIRADRLGIDSSDLKLIANGDIESIKTEVLKQMPKVLIVDSIQTIYMNSYPSTPGSIVQVRECGIFLQRLAKEVGVPIIIIGHVTKEGTLAGPRILEHIVDVVLYLEGERFHDARLLRGVKNRFGATDEVGIFTMTEKGMIEVKNPSLLFLAEKSNKPGSAVVVTMEGTRPILVEIQSLTIPSNFGFPKRTSSGIDLNRVNLLAAVLTRNTKINLSNHDIYINVVGGMKIREPAVDLAICSAIASSYLNKKVDQKFCFFGEVGLSGEVRRVTRSDSRAKEAGKLGYKYHSNLSVTDLAKLIEILFQKI